MNHHAICLVVTAFLPPVVGHHHWRFAANWFMAKPSILVTEPMVLPQALVEWPVLFGEWGFRSYAACIAGIVSRLYGGGAVHMPAVCGHQRIPVVSAVRNVSGLALANLHCTAWSVMSPVLQVPPFTTSLGVFFAASLSNAELNAGKS